MTRKVDGACNRLLRLLLPLKCLLCGAPGDDDRDICSACAHDFAINAPCCPICALPLKTSAPMCGACIERPPPFAAAWAPFRYEHPLDLLEARFKFRGDLAAGRVLADLMLERAAIDRPTMPDAFVAVPLHDARLRRRGYNQAFELARSVSTAFGLPLLRDLIARTRATAEQTGLDASARRRNLRGAFRVARVSHLPAHIAIVDNVMTTGATLRECARMLRRAGVARIDAWALARAPQSRA